MTDAFPEAYFDFRIATVGLQRGWPWVATLAIGGALLGLGLGLLMPRDYTARAAFAPVVSSSPGQAADILRNLPLGLSSGSNIFGGAITASEIYPDILSSSNLLRTALSRPWQPRPGARPRSYREEFGYAGEDSTVAMAKAVRRIRKQIKVSLNKSNGIVTIDFSQRDPRLAAGFLDALLSALNEFNTTVRQTQAGGVRRFLENRIVEARKELEVAEEELALFRDRNVRFERAPLLALEETRLQRRIRLCEAIFQTLSQQYEFARIDEARDTPTLSIIEPPVAPALASSPGPLTLSLFGSVLGFLVGAATAMRRAWVSVLK